MNLIITFLGLLIGALAILYLLDIFDQSKLEKKQQKHSTPEGLKNAIIKTLKENQTKKPEKRLRICPICGTILSQKDYLIAAFEPQKNPNIKRQVHIYGCVYCFTTDGVNKNLTSIKSLDL